MKLIWIVCREEVFCKADKLLYRRWHHRKITLLLIEDKIARFLRCRMERINVVIDDQMFGEWVNEAVLVWVIMMNEVVDREKLCQW